MFFAKNVKTPLMILHNDRDGAVDFTQGVEYFNTLRRLQKPVIMLEYVGENHGLRKPANQRDYTVRMKEYFDHYLMGAPAPEWMTKGVPRLKMEEHLKERAAAEAACRSDRRQRQRRRQVAARRRPQNGDPPRKDCRRRRSLFHAVVCRPAHLYDRHDL